MKRIQGIVVGLSLMMGISALAQTRRYEGQAAAQWQAFISGQSTDILEFQKGDIVNFGVAMQGSLLATHGEAPPLALAVQRGFYLKHEGGRLLLSFDGAAFKPLTDLLSGVVQVSASGHPVNALQLLVAASERQPASQADGGGVGLILEARDEEGLIVVKGLTAGSPAERVGTIARHDTLLAVKSSDAADWVNTTNLPLATVVGLIRGPAGTEVGLRFKHHQGEEYEVHLKRVPL